MRNQRSTAPRPRAAVAAAACLLAVGAPAAARAEGLHVFSGQTAHRVLDLVNEERWRAGCGSLVLEERLNASAREHSRDMAVRHLMSHQGSDGSGPVDRIRRSGYRPSAWGENVARGYGSAEEVVRAWMSSPEHRWNILDCEYREMGLGVADPGDYWTQDFGTPR
ncbi:CAP domain-containing protein [Streptomyces sp. NPDC001380]|uniref:CAP domain-containing protein n=1 Tax=Streptomyces sp. NPDC001380 TaxID=3364566 RepID=UPI003686718B